MYKYGQFPSPFFDNTVHSSVVAHSDYPVTEMDTQKKQFSFGDPNDPDVQLAMDFASAINRHSRENASDTPDHILAKFLVGCLKVFEEAAVERDKWYGTKRWEHNLELKDPK